MSVVESMMLIMGPNEVVSVSLLAACRMHVNVGFGGSYNVSFGRVKASLYCCRTYMHVGKWDGAGVVMNVTKEKGIKKNPGFCVVEINGQNEFVSGDRGSMQSKSIHEAIKLLNIK